MGIFGFLFGLGCLVVIAWAIALLGGLVFGRKHRQQNRPQEQPSPKPTQLRERFNSPPPPIAAHPIPTVPRRRVVVLRQPPVSTRVRLPSNRHQHYIQLADSVLKQLRDACGGSRSDHRIVVVQLPEARYSSQDESLRV